MKASWSTAITFGNDMKVTAEPRTLKPLFEEPECANQMGLNTLRAVYADFNGELKGEAVDFEQFVGSINGALRAATTRVTYGNNGAFQITKPVFNRKGDFIFDLQVANAPRLGHADPHRGAGFVSPKCE